jgi:predicted  nucleic acid-binding Zn-ribbon protein
MTYRLKYRTTRPVRNAVALALGTIILGALGACSSVSDLARERVAQSETSVEQAQQTLGKSEQGAMELQQARDKLNTAKSALAKGQGQEAERAAAQAHLYAELAVAKSQSAAARKSADEVLASIETLRQETERSTPTQR